MKSIRSRSEWKNVVSMFVLFYTSVATQAVWFNSFQLTTVVQMKVTQELLDKFLIYLAQKFMVHR